LLSWDNKGKYIYRIARFDVVIKSNDFISIKWFQYKKYSKNQSEISMKLITIKDPRKLIAWYRHKTEYTLIIPYYISAEIS